MAGAERKVAFQKRTEMGGRHDGILSSHMTQPDLILKILRNGAECGRQISKSRGTKANRRLEHSRSSSGMLGDMPTKNRVKKGGQHWALLSM